MRSCITPFPRYIMWGGRVLLHLLHPWNVKKRSPCKHHTLFFYFFNLLALKMLIMSMDLDRTLSKKWEYSHRDSLLRALYMFSAAFNLASSHWLVKKSCRASHCVHPWQLGAERASMSEIVSAFYQAQHDRSPDCRPCLHKDIMSDRCIFAPLFHLTCATPYLFQR